MATATRRCRSRHHPAQASFGRRSGKCRHERLSRRRICDRGTTRSGTACTVEIEKRCGPTCEESDRKQALDVERENVDTSDYLGEGYVTVGQLDLARLELSKLRSVAAQLARSQIGSKLWTSSGKMSTRAIISAKDM